MELSFCGNSQRTLVVNSSLRKASSLKFNRVLNKSLKLLLKNCHYVKSNDIRRISGPYFPAFGLNMERCGVSRCIQSECGSMRTRKTPNTDTFHAVCCVSYFPISVHFPFYTSENKTKKPLWYSGIFRGYKNENTSQK